MLSFPDLTEVIGHFLPYGTQNFDSISGPPHIVSVANRHLSSFRKAFRKLYFGILFKQNFYAIPFLLKSQLCNSFAEIALTA